MHVEQALKSKEYLWEEAVRGRFQNAGRASAEGEHSRTSTPTRLRAAEGDTAQQQRHVHLPAHRRLS